MRDDTAPVSPIDVEQAVRERYGRGAQEREEALCCPTSYDPRLLEAIPKEVIERDYGCGDPSAHLRAGETVLDLGSGGGKICFIASQVVGAGGRVIGVDMNDEMLALARRSRAAVAARVGHDNVVFHKARIQDLAIDRDRVDAWLREHPVRGEADWARLEAHLAELRATAPLVADGSVDVVVSNCVLNLVAPADKRRLFGEIFRVLRPGGRAVISDIVSDREVPARLMADPELWSGCVSGALEEHAFVEAFERAGFHGVTIAERGDAPWRTVEGIDFRSVTVIAYKGDEAAVGDGEQVVIYRGPWKRVEDDEGNLLQRGARTSVGGRAFARYRSEPYAGLVAPASGESVAGDAPAKACGPKGCC